MEALSSPGGVLSQMIVKTTADMSKVIQHRAAYSPLKHLCRITVVNRETSRRWKKPTCLNEQTRCVLVVCRAEEKLSVFLRQMPLFSSAQSSKKRYLVEWLKDNSGA